ncbi:hypothetical protein E2C01_099468 [Portunus trituberculatus]|uniref:Uncharacterized protein n=1 Tax=Portunus trituberculatus TaxID=210409 RepID=A0A5B7KAV0_PORTR|nr:hypothetical protein [Portunus trituberculatus]
MNRRSQRSSFLSLSCCLSQHQLGAHKLVWQPHETPRAGRGEGVMGGWVWASQEVGVMPRHGRNGTVSYISCLFVGVLQGPGSMRRRVGRVSAAW